MARPISSDQRERLWKAVSKAKSEGLPKTAVKHLQAIYDSAIEDRKFVEATRAYCTMARTCLLYTSPSPRDGLLSRMPSSA